MFSSPKESNLPTLSYNKPNNLTMNAGTQTDHATGRGTLITSVRIYHSKQGGIPKNLLLYAGIAAQEVCELLEAYFKVNGVIGLQDSEDTVYPLSVLCLFPSHFSASVYSLVLESVPTDEDIARRSSVTFIEDGNQVDLESLVDRSFSENRPSLEQAQHEALERGALALSLEYPAPEGGVDLTQRPKASRGPADRDSASGDMKTHTGLTPAPTPRRYPSDAHVINHAINDDASRVLRM